MNSWWTKQQKKLKYFYKTSCQVKTVCCLINNLFRLISWIFDLLTLVFSFFNCTNHLQLLYTYIVRIKNVLFYWATYLQYSYNCIIRTKNVQLYYLDKKCVTHLQFIVQLSCSEYNYTTVKLFLQLYKFPNVRLFKCTAERLSRSMYKLINCT